jgi:hypothetical protein
MKEFICPIRPENFNEEVASEKRPVLLFCMPFGETFPAQMKIVEDIAETYIKDIKVGVLEEAYMDTFKRNLNIHGTPTYLLMVQGMERNRMIGLMDREALIAFIFSS